MKTQIKSVSKWSVKGVIAVTILSAMLCAFGAKANNKPSVALNAVKVEMKSESGVDSRMNSMAEINNKAVEEYNAKNFVAAELALETESWMNINAGSDNEVAQYNAEEYAEAELVLEIEGWMNNSCF